MRILDESEVEKTFVERDLVLSPADELHSVQAPATAVRPVVGQTRIGFGLVVDTVGTGGTASVYKVWNERLELFRAVKMLSVDTLHARFETEVKLSAKLRHPHIVEVYNVGEWNGVPYMEMEYVDGSNLQETLAERGRLPDAVCCAAAICVAGALDYAHTLKFTLGGNAYDGIIHRDLKPANILVSKHSGIKLTDFGIARPAQASLHTIEGNIVGTLHYLSPEQMEGGAVDQRSDIYSLGAILYEMATGVKAFPQKSIAELTRHRAANSFKPPSEYAAPVHPALSDIILKCLKAPALERYQSAAELIGDLQRAYFSMAPGDAPQKTLHKFFSGEAFDADPAPTTSINVNDAMNAAEAEKKPAEKQPPAKLPMKPRFGNAVAYALAALLAVLTIYLTIGHISPPHRGKAENKQADAARFFPADNSAERGDTPPPNAPARNDDRNGGEETDTRVSTASIKPPAATESTPVAGQDANRAVKTNDAPAYAGADTSTTVNAHTNTHAAAVTDAAAPTAGAIATANASPAKSSPSPAPAPPPTPVATENALIKNASEAMAKKEWDRAIRILEKNGAVFTEKRTERTLLLLEAYVESRQLDKARPLIDGAAPINDAMYFLTAGRYWFYRGDHANALSALEASLTRPSLLRNRNATVNDAMYYIALVRSERFKSAPTTANRTLALDAWKRVKTAYEPTPESPQFKRATTEIAALN